MMKALNNSSPKDFDGDKNSLEMKCLNSNCESSVNLSCESTSLENSVDKLGLETDSFLNSHESLSTSLPSVCASKASNSSQEKRVRKNSSNRLTANFKATRFDC